ncbi:MAG: methylmalonyl-CoA mutase [Micrococcales bacterium]|nr:methylmalonyl-CoA mutase [Micrococcales bacterium]
MTENLDLASDYSPTREQWLAAVDKVLKGKDFDLVLVSTTLDDVRIEPLYTADDVATTHDESGFPGSDPLTRGAQPAPRTDGQWDIRSRVTHPDPAVANAQILEDLANGATSVDLQLDLGGGSGISIRSPQDLARVLDGVVLDAAPVSLRAGAHAAVVAGWYRELLAERGVHGAEPSGCLGIDPVGTLVTDGEVAMDALMAAGLDVANTPRLRTFRASGAPASDAGASEAQEIGYMLSVALLYLRALIDAGVDNPASRITLEVTADVDVFATVAKLRALRHCWATVLEHMGQPLDNTGIEAVSADRWLTEVDPWVNILRGTAATLGAVVGGAESVTIAPFDSASGLPGGLGRRLARNTQLLLQDESGIGRVLDPAGGSSYIESFTDDLAAAAWKFFQRIEAADGPGRRRRDRHRHRGGGCAPRQGHRHSQATNHRSKRVPATRRATTGTDAGAGPGRSPRGAGTRPRAPGHAVAAPPPRPALRGPAGQRRGRHGVPGQPRPDRRAHRPGHVRREPLRRWGHHGGLRRRARRRAVGR